LLLREGVRGEIHPGRNVGYLADGTKIAARTAICATGISYLRLELPNEASVAYGYAIVISTTPGLRETVRGPDVPIKIQFNSRIDFRRARLTLLAPGGKQTALGIVEASSEDSLISEAKGLKKWDIPCGEYRCLANLVKRGEDCRE
jgi:hypothetical protein